MISHEHKVIFIHISKCAGTSVEKAFGIDLKNNTETNNKHLFGWNGKAKMHLQHATPQQLIDNGFLSTETWNSYYKFIIVRNPYSRAVSDYFWIIKDKQILDSFKNFILRKGRFKTVLTNNNTTDYRGDHLNTQKDYFFLNGKEIQYDRVLRLETIKDDFKSLGEDLKLKSNFFQHTTKKAIIKFSHYSVFYNQRRKHLVASLFGDDLKYLKYTYEERKTVLQHLKSQLPAVFFIPLKYWKKYIKQKVVK